MYGTKFNPKIFTDITIPDIKSYSPNTGKISVLFMISVTNLHFSEIEGSCPKSLPENRIEGESKNTRCCGLR